MNHLSRRDFIRVSGLIAAGTVAAACLPETTPPAADPTAVPGQAPPEAPAQPEAPAPTGRYNEAPVLAERVASGQLPPVDERLPENPVAWPVFESIGKYGGRIRRGFSGMADRIGPQKMVRRRLNWFNPDLTIRNDLAESWETNEDASTWTFHLRRGGKWSDGEPFTSRDFRYYHDDFMLNQEINPSVSSAFRAGSGADEAVVELDTPDDFTVIYRFVAPKPLFHYVMADATPFAPAHFMQQYHPDYADEADLAQQARAAGFETWAQLYADKDSWYLTPERPAVDTWIPTNTLAEELFVCERNPYFMGVDSEGNQLPYLDTMTHRLYESGGVFALWILNGEIDFTARSLPNFTLLKEGEQQGGYHIQRGYGEGHNGMNPNHATKNPLVREFFQNRDVRIAMNLAMNRSEINDLVYDDQLTPRQYSPTEGSPQYYPKASDIYVDYDPDRANELLDGAGYNQRGPDGYRLWKDGSGPVTFVITGRSADPADDMLMWVKYLGDVGIRGLYNGVDRSLYEVLCNTNEIECGNWGGDRTHLPIIQPTIFLGTQMDRPWAGAWGLW